MYLLFQRISQWWHAFKKRDVPPTPEDWLSEYFQRKDFGCKCGCGYDSINLELVGVLTLVCRHFSKSAKINSGCRCQQHNANVGGEDKSKHLYGLAADVVYSGVDPCAVADYLEKLSGGNRWGIGRYLTFTHIDVRKNKARWGSN